MMTREQFICHHKNLLTYFLTLETVCKKTNCQEVTRREQEISEKKAALDDMKRKNRLVQDKVGKLLSWLQIIMQTLTWLMSRFKNKSRL